MKNKNTLTYKNMLWARKKGFIISTKMQKYSTEQHHCIVPCFVQALKTLLKMLATNTMQYFGGTYIPNNIRRAKEYTIDGEYIRDYSSFFKSTYFQEPDPVAAQPA